MTSSVFDPKDTDTMVKIYGRYIVKDTSNGELVAFLNDEDTLFEVIKLKAQGKTELTSSLIAKFDAFVKETERRGLAEYLPPNIRSALNL